MSGHRPLNTRFPQLGRQYQTIRLADLPTPVIEKNIDIAGTKRKVFVKCDDLTSPIYGGNKVRKLEYLLFQARKRQCERIATFGAVGSHHALATALYARQAGFGCTCFLSHQRRTSSIARTLRTHIDNETEIVRYGGSYATRIATLRQSLWNRKSWVIPAGGSSWLGALGFVNAGLELAGQIERGELPRPDRIYVAAGTLGTVAGLALGLAIAKIPSVIHAVRVTEETYSGQQLLDRLLRKTAMMLHRADPQISGELIAATRVELREGFFAGGYAHTDAATDNAVRFAKDMLGIGLETTYTGKTMAAMLSDMKAGISSRESILFWNTFSSAQPADDSRVDDIEGRLPAEFRAYLS